MTAARGQFVVAVNDGRPLSREQAAPRQRVEGALQQARLPPIEQIAGNDEVIGSAGDDAIELMLERGSVGGVPHMQV